MSDFTIKGVPLVAQQHQEPKNKNTHSISSLGRRSCPLHADRCCCEYTYEGEGYPTIHVFPTVAACEQWKEQSTALQNVGSCSTAYDRMIFSQIGTVCKVNIMIFMKGRTGQKTHHAGFPHINDHAGNVVLACIF